MKNLQKSLMSSIMLLPLVSWAGDDDPCGIKLRVSQPVGWGQQQRVQAVETITATSIISKSAQGDYQAGQSVTLLPGFQAKHGSLFTAQARACECGSGELERNQLTLTAYPNPFVESTVIRYRLTEGSPVTLTLLNEQGQLITTLVSETQEAGVHEYTYRDSSLRESVYLYALRTKEGLVTKRLVKGH